MAVHPRDTSDAAPTATADVVVIGGGPAGSTAAILLVERGYRVVVLEKSRHPRFHIGESLLPANLPLFERLGVSEQIRAIGMEKWGAEFVSPWHGRGETFLFSEAWRKSMPYAYQVRRSQFDEILIRRAAHQGATVIEDCRVRQVEFLGGVRGARIEAERSDGSRHEWRSRFVIDASGRDTFLANQFGAKRRNKKHNSAAMYAHFAGAERYAGNRAGNISIYWFEHGWFWLIPLADGATSVGAVVWPYYMKSRHEPVRDFFLTTIRMCEPLAKRLTNAALVSNVEATGNYSYACDHSCGENYLLIGDAYAFIDPVFSSGVWLAMNSAVAGAKAVDACLREPARAASALRRFDRTMRRGPREFSWFIYRVTTPTMRELFMNPRNPLRMKEALLSVLAGDIFGRTPIWPSLSAFKGVYFATSLFNLRRTLAAVRSRQRNIADAEGAAGSH
jgi:flavin-dependent dehydrogenase